MESLPVIIVLTFGLVFLFLASGLWISIGLGAVGIILLFFLVGGGREALIGNLQFNIVNTYVFTMMPLFIFMGELVLRSGMSERLYRGATPWVGFLPGGLLHTNIASCSIFAAVTGSSVACVATIGTVAIPELEKRGYDRKMMYGSLAAGGSLGVLIPPSMVMVIYGVFVEESIGRLFIAGIFPGLILAGLFMSYIGGTSILRPHLVAERLKLSPRRMASSLLDIGPMMVLIFMVLGTIYLGLATPTEAAAMGAFGALVLAALFRRLTWSVLKIAAVEAAVLSSWIVLIMICARILSMGLSYLRVPRDLSNWVASLEVDRLVILVFIAILYVILGMFIDGISMMLLTLPITYPLMMALGFDSIWFGVMIVLFTQMAVITPPVGVNLYVVHGLTGRKYLTDIIIGIIPFFLCMVIMLIILTAFPNLATWLPEQMIQKF